MEREKSNRRKKCPFLAKRLRTARQDRPPNFKICHDTLPTVREGRNARGTSESGSAKSRGEKVEEKGQGTVISSGNQPPIITGEERKPQRTEKSKHNRSYSGGGHGGLSEKRETKEKPRLRPLYLRTPLTEGDVPFLWLSQGGGLRGQQRGRESNVGPRLQTWQKLPQIL